MPVMMELFILTEAFFQYGYYDIVESSMRGKFWLFLKTKFMEKACDFHIPMQISAFGYSNNSVDPDIMLHFKKIQNHLVGAVSAELRKMFAV